MSLKREDIREKLNIPIMVAPDSAYLLCIAAMYIFKVHCILMKCSYFGKKKEQQSF